MPNYDETWVTLPGCDGPCPMRRFRNGDSGPTIGWKCAKCGAYKKDKPEGLIAQVGGKSSNSIHEMANNPRGDEPIKLDSPPTIKIHGYGCVVIIGMLFVFLGWLAWLDHLVRIARAAQ